jgi:hypothetical protein
MRKTWLAACRRLASRRAGRTESAKSWLSVLNELKNRGVKDVLVFTVDNLKGISKAIEDFFPRAEGQNASSIRSELSPVCVLERTEGDGQGPPGDLRSAYRAGRCRCCG